MPTPQEVAAYKLTKELGGFTKEVLAAKAKLAEIGTEAKSIAEAVKDLDAETFQSMKKVEALATSLTETRTTIQELASHIQDVNKGRLVSADVYDRENIRFAEGIKYINEVTENLVEKEEKANIPKNKSDKKIQDAFELAQKAYDKAMKTYTPLAKNAATSMTPAAAESQEATLGLMRTALKSYKKLLAELQDSLTKFNSSLKTEKALMDKVKKGHPS